MRHERCFGDEKVVVLRDLPGCFLIACHFVKVFAAYDNVRAGVFGSDCEIPASDDCDLHRLASRGWEFE